MKIGKSSEIEPVLVDNEKAKGITARVLIGKAQGAGNFCMRKFEIAPGGYTPRHSHDWEHEVFIHSGTGVIFNQGEWTPIEPGSFVFVPGDEEHQFKNTGDEPLVFVCLIPSGAPEL
jgi:quercetin dioxygenase-like cupin family protein